MTSTQPPHAGRAGRPAAGAVAPLGFGSVGRLVRAHTALAEPLITVEGPDVVLAPREAISLSGQLVAACLEVCRHRPDIAQRDQLDAAINGAGREQSYRQRLSELVDTVAPVVVDAYAHSPYRTGVTTAMQRLQAEQERLNAEAAESADARVLPSA